MTNFQYVYAGGFSYDTLGFRSGHCQADGRHQITFFCLKITAGNSKWQQAYGWQKVGKPVWLYEGRPARLWGTWPRLDIFLELNRQDLWIISWTQQITLYLPLWRTT